MNLTELYETDSQFRGYVDRYCKHYGKTVGEALTHAIVRNYAERGEEDEKVQCRR